jgi:hypothetical protein
MLPRAPRAVSSPALDGRARAPHATRRPGRHDLVWLSPANPPPGSRRTRPRMARWRVCRVARLPHGRHALGRIAVLRPEPGRARAGLADSSRALRPDVRPTTRTCSPTMHTARLVAGTRLRADLSQSQRSTSPRRETWRHPPGTIVTSTGSQRRRARARHRGECPRDPRGQPWFGDIYAQRSLEPALMWARRYCRMRGHGHPGLPGDRERSAGRLPDRMGGRARERDVRPTAMSMPHGCSRAAGGRTDGARRYAVARPLARRWHIVADTSAAGSCPRSNRGWLRGSCASTAWPQRDPSTHRGAPRVIPSPPRRRQPPSSERRDRGRAGRPVPGVVDRERSVRA